MGSLATTDDRFIFIKIAQGFGALTHDGQTKTMLKEFIGKAIAT